MKTLLLASVAALSVLIASIEAHALADGFTCAMVKQTPDGFLNLRAGLIDEHDKNCREVAPG